jgi:hypothetical protein
VVALERARVAFVLVLASGDGFGSRPVTLAAVRRIVGGSQRGGADERSDDGSTRKLQHEGLHDEHESRDARSTRRPVIQ